jgi:hypothetical protein|tara:strand:- start:253 stop:540 length:288 start_codon:yes stop_codon:yes gene_type:complete
MFDNNVEINTNELAKAIALLGKPNLSKEQLELVQIKDAKGEFVYVAINLINRIQNTTIYQPERRVAKVFYFTGEDFVIDIDIAELASQLKISKEI